jgi:signal transduction histidine kinase
MVKMMDHVLGALIQVSFEPARDLPAVLGDDVMIDQVIMNLAINARDAMPKGGRLV